jgi:hypothetical protein
VRASSPRTTTAASQRRSAADRSRRRRRAAQNPIQRENALPGTSSWGNGDWRDSTIQGYASETSVDRVSSRGDYRVEIFRLGWYGGVGGREREEGLYVEPNVWMVDPAICS